MLREHFLEGTEGTVTGASIGAEIETDFVQEDNPMLAIDVEQTRKILAATKGRPSVCMPPKLELGRQKIEIAVLPQPTPELMLEAVQESLQWLYKAAAEVRALPVFRPDWEYSELWEPQNLLWIQEERDHLWVELDGIEALENLARISSVQFTVAVNPKEAIDVVNRLWAAQIHKVDYERNDQYWRWYIEGSVAKYRRDRYAGPEGFMDMDDYVAQLTKHEVVMNNGKVVRQSADQVPDLNVELFLRSVWWHYRLRRYGETLAVEVRPIGRRTDDQIPQAWNMVAGAIGL